MLNDDRATISSDLDFVLIWSGIIADDDDADVVVVVQIFQIVFAEVEDDS